MRFVTFRNRINLAAVILMTISLFGFIGNVAIDYNWGTTPVVSSIAIFYGITLKWIIPYPVGYWGLGAVVYFAFFLLSFGILNRKEPPFRNILEVTRLASVILVLFEVGVYYYVPLFMNKWVIDAVKDTALESFTNWDLLATSMTLFILSNLILVRSNHSRMASQSGQGPSGM